MKIVDWNIEAMTGYKPKTTFYLDFSIADHFGETAIKNTFGRAFCESKSDVVYLTELVMALNWKIWEHYNVNDDYAKLYDTLWREADNYCRATLSGDDLIYYCATTD